MAPLPFDLHKQTFGHKHWSFCFVQVWLFYIMKILLSLHQYPSYFIIFIITTHYSIFLSTKVLHDLFCSSSENKIYSSKILETAP